MSQAANYSLVQAVPYLVPIVPVSAVYYPVVVQYHSYTVAVATVSKGLSGPQQPNLIAAPKKTESPWSKLLEKPKKPSPWDTLMSKQEAGREKTEEKNSRHSTEHCSFTIGTVVCRGCHPSHSFYCTAGCPDCGC